MKTTFLVFLLLVAGIVIADTLQETSNVPSLYNVPVPVPVHDTIYQKVYLENAHTIDFWNSNFWTSFFPFLIAALSIYTVVYQHKKIIPSEADKLMLNERFKTHVELMDLLKNIMVTRISRTGKYRIYSLFQSIEHLKTANENLIEFRAKHAVTLTLRVKEQMHLLTGIIGSVLDYAKTDIEVRKIGMKFHNDVESIFVEVGNSLAYFFETEIRKQYVFPNLSTSKKNVINEKLNNLTIIKETVGKIERFDTNHELE